MNRRHTTDGPSSHRGRGRAATARTATAISLAGAILLALAGCEIAGTEGEAGALTFHDTTRAPGEFVQTDQRFDRDLAESALLAVEVRQGGLPAAPTAAKSSDAAVFEVVRVDTTGVLLRGVAPGTARLTVEAGGVEDSVPVTVAAIGQTVVHFYPVGELAADQPALDVTDAVLLPGARLWGFVEQRGPGGATLTGYGATPCAVAGDGAAVRMDAEGDRFTLDAPAAKGDVEAVTLTCGPTEVTLPLRTAAAATALEAYDFGREVFGPTLTVEPGQSTYVVVIARDDEGRVVQGAADEPVTVTVPEASKPYVQVVPHESDTELDTLLRQSRAFEVRVQAGKPSHTVTVGWHGLTMDLTLALE